MARYRMKQLAALTGMSRQAIHFYIKKGLVPPPIKRGATSAEYTDEHLERIRDVRRLREEQFLPLDAIRASIDQRDEQFTPAQQRVIAGVRGQLSRTPRAPGVQATVSVATAARRAGVPRDEVEAMIDAGFVTAHEDARGRARIARDELWLIQIWGELRALGFDPDHGFSPIDIARYERRIDELVEEEVAMVADRLSDLPPAELARQIERALPVIGSMLAQLHETAVRRFLAEMIEESE